MPHYLVGVMPASKQQNPNIISRSVQEGYGGPIIVGVEKAPDEERACEQAATEHARPGSYFALEVTPVEVGFIGTRSST